MALIDLFDRAAARWPDRPFVVDADRQWTHAEAKALSHRIAGGLRALGCGIGSHVAVWSPNCGIGFITMLGTFRAGVAWIPVQARNTIDTNLDYLASTRAEVIFAHSSVTEGLVARLDELPDVRQVICIDRDVPGALGIETWAAANDPVPTPTLRAGDTFALLGTGGTTGRPKAAILTQLTIETEVANFLIAMPPGDTAPVNLMATPMTHGAGFTAFPLFGVGATHVILARAASRDVLDAIEQYRVSYLFLPPTVVYDMLADPTLDGRDVSSLRHFIYAAAPMSVDKLQQAIATFGPVMTQVYGQAEAPLMCTYLGPGDHDVGDGNDRRLWSCGRATMFTPVAVLDGDGNELPPGERGEIAVRGNLVMAGYYANADATAATRAGGWHRTGDIGHIDEDGFMYLVDRSNDMIITGGFNVYPSEVEQVLWAHPAVKDCAVVGAPHERWGEEVVAAVELKASANGDPNDIVAFARQRLGGVKAPKRVEIWHELPRSAVGKVMRRSVRDTFWQGKERAI